MLIYQMKTNACILQEKKGRKEFQYSMSVDTTGCQVKTGRMRTVERNISVV